MVVNGLNEMKETWNSHEPTPARHDDFLLPHVGRFGQLVNQARHCSWVSIVVLICGSLVEASTG